DGEREEQCGGRAETDHGLHPPPHCACRQRQQCPPSRIEVQGLPSASLRSTPTSVRKASSQPPRSGASSCRPSSKASSKRPTISAPTSRARVSTSASSTVVTRPSRTTQRPPTSTECTALVVEP